MAKKQRKPAEIDAAEAEIEAQLQQITEQRERGMLGFDYDTAMAAAALARALVSFRGERRQQAKAEARELDSFPVEQVVAHLKQRLSVDEIAEVVRDLAGEKEEEALL